MVAACGYFDELPIPVSIDLRGVVNLCRRFLLARILVIAKSTISSRTPTEHVALGLSDRARETTTGLEVFECVTAVHFLRGIGVDQGTDTQLSGAVVTPTEKFVIGRDGADMTRSGTDLQPIHVRRYLFGHAVTAPAPQFFGTINAAHPSGILIGPY